jgi:hypothetical protein
MKKIYQIGFIAALVALLPTGILFAGNGDGDGKDKKNTVNVRSTEGTGTVMLTITTTNLVATDQVNIHTKNTGSYVKEVNPVVGGIQVTIEIDPTTFFTDPDNDGGIIIEIVGVDNITGVNATDGNNGSTIPANLVAADKDHTYTDAVQGSGTSFHTQPASTIPTGTTSFSSAKKDISVYPNPVTDETNVVTVGEILGKTIQIMDLSGHVVMTTIVSKGSRQTVLNLSMLTPGVYVLMYTTEDGQTISKKIQKI